MPQIIKDIASIFFPLCTLIVAMIGLTTWRKKLWGENKFSLALCIIENLYELKEQIRYYRNPIYTPSELYSAYKQMNESDKKEEKTDPLKIAKSAEIIRWNNIVNENIKYNTSMLKFKILINNYKFDKINDTDMSSFIGQMYSARTKKEMNDKKVDKLQFMSSKQQEEYFNKEEDIDKILIMKNDKDIFDINVEQYFTAINKKLRKYLR
jgi:hypothetical protein